MLSLAIEDRCHLLADGRPLGVPDRVHELLQHFIVALGTLAMTMWVLHPVSDQLDVAPNFRFEDLCNLLGICGHNLLKLFGPHHLGSPFHFILPKLHWEVFILIKKTNISVIELECA